MLKRVAMAMVVALTVSAAASAQTSTVRTVDRPRRRRSTPATTDAMPATASGHDHVMGDTGLWFVPTGEVLPAKRWSVSAYRVNFDSPPGVHRRVQLAGHVRLRPRRPRRDLRRVDRRPPHRPRLTSDVPPDGLHDGRSRSTSIRSCARDGPTTSSAISWLGAKVNLMSQWQQQPVGVRVARHGQAADREETTRKGSAPASSTSRSTRSSARKSTSASSSPATAASCSVAIRTRSTCRTDSAGASAPASRRARACR